jgi:hypothetical protein
MNDLIPINEIAEKICLLRGQKVILDRDLAWLYGVETRVLNQAVKRNIKRFPDDFMFQLSQSEYDALISQIVISKRQGKGGTRKMPYAFTEQGIAMLSGVLNSDRAIAVNIQIMRTFTHFRRMISIGEDLERELVVLREQTDERFQVVFEALDQIFDTENLPRKRIGFTIKEELSVYGQSDH